MANDDVRYGVLLPTREICCGAWRADGLVGFARVVESLGFASVWAGDALQLARLEPLTVLAAVAGSTERVLLGTAAITPAIREPFITAQAIATLDVLSKGRVVLAVGAGFPDTSRAQFDAAGVDYHTRYSRLDTIVAQWRRLWSGDVDPDLPEVPLPVQPGGPPIWLAGATPRALAAVGDRFDGWMPYPPDPAAYRAGLDRIQHAAAASGRDAAAITASLYATALVADDEHRARAALDRYCQAFYGAPIEQVEATQVVIAASTDHIRAELERFVDAGARHIVLRIAALGPGDQLERIAAALDVPAARASIKPTQPPLEIQGADHDHA